jgi:hypothetical protein
MNPKKAPCLRACRITRFVGLAVACCLALTPASAVGTDTDYQRLDAMIAGCNSTPPLFQDVNLATTTGNQTASMRMRKLKINHQPTCGHCGHLSTNPS